MLTNPNVFMNIEFIIIFCILALISIGLYVLIFEQSLRVTRKYLEIVGKENLSLLHYRTLAVLRFVYGLGLVFLIIQLFFYLMTF